MKLNVQGKEDGSESGAIAGKGTLPSRFAMDDFSVVLVGCDVRLMMTQLGYALGQ